MKKLHTWIDQQASLSGVVRWAKEHLARAWVVAYSPGRCWLERAEDVSAESLAGSYELRCFCQQAELRWVQGHGAVCLTEQEGWTPPDGWVQLATGPLVLLDVLERSYLLWGTADQAHELPTVLFDHRIGELRVPIRCERTSARVRLLALEYVAVDGEYGNASVLAERLVRLEECDD